jgi:putative ribosome biogenesis GTPase RsgA
MRAVIVVAGNSGHGKSTVSDLISEFWGKERSLQCAFADPVKEAAMILTGMPREVAYGDQAVRKAWATYGRTAREFQQLVGTEIGRKMINENVWVDRTVDHIARHVNTHDMAVVSDGRFWNEVNGLPKRVLTHQAFTQTLPPRVISIVVWRQNAPTLGEPPTLLNRFLASGVATAFRKLFGLERVKLMHPSESEVWEMRRKHQAGQRVFDIFLENNSGLDHLKMKVKDIVSGIKRELVESGRHDW